MHKTKTNKQKTPKKQKPTKQNKTIPKLSMSPKYIRQKLTSGEKSAFLYTQTFIYLFLHPNKSLTCKVRGKIKLCVLSIILNGGKLK